MPRAGGGPRPNERFFCTSRLHGSLASNTKENKEPGLQMAKERDFKVVFVGVALSDV